MASKRKRKPLFLRPIEVIDPHPELQGVYALIEGLRAGGADIVHAKHRLQAREQRQHRLRSLVLFTLLSGSMIYVMWAGIHG